MRRCWKSLQCREVFHHMTLSCEKAQEQESWIRNLNSTFLLGFEVRTGNLCIFQLKTRALAFLASLENVKAKILNLVTRTWKALRRHQGHPLAFKWCNGSLLCHSQQMLLSFLFKNIILGNCTVCPGNRFLCFTVFLPYNISLLISSLILPSCNLNLLFLTLSVVASGSFESIPLFCSL